MTVTGDNEYGVRVYRNDLDDERVGPVQRALHAELCRAGRLGLHSTGLPACERALSVVRRAQADMEGTLRL